MVLPLCPSQSNPWLPRADHHRVVFLGNTFLKCDRPSLLKHLSAQCEQGAPPQQSGSEAGWLCCVDSQLRPLTLWTPRLVTVTVAPFPHPKSVPTAQDFIGCPQDYNRAVLDTESVAGWRTDSRSSAICQSGPEDLAQYAQGSWEERDGVVSPLHPDACTHTACFSGSTGVQVSIAYGGCILGLLADPWGHCASTDQECWGVWGEGSPFCNSWDTRERGLGWAV